MTLRINSQSFAEGGPIPRRFTCEGDDVSPDLTWSGAPPGTRSFVLIVDDPDAPDPAAPKMVWDHWLLYNLPADCTGLPAGVTAADLPPGTKEGINSWGRSRYGGPCPPIGRHRYFYRLYALDTLVAEIDDPTKDRLLLAIDGHILARTELVGTYRKGEPEGE